MNPYSRKWLWILVGVRDREQLIHSRNPNGKKQKKNQHMKRWRCSASQAMRKIYIKSMVDYHFTQISKNEKNSWQYV